MNPYCPRCDVQFEKDVPRCPACGWDFRASKLPADFLTPPLNFGPLKEFPHFILHNLSTVLINGLTVEALWILGIVIFYRATYGVSLLFQVPGRLTYFWILSLAVYFATILIFPVFATYIFSLLRRYRYHVPVPLFAVFAPPGKSRYGESLAWAPLCLIIGGTLVVLLIFPGVLFFTVYIPFLLLMHLDKLNISRQRRRFILIYMFKRLWILFLITGIIMTLIWLIPLLLSYLFHRIWGIILASLLFPLQSAFSMLLYESLVGRVNLDPD